jgi:hypothetical protein
MPTFPVSLRWFVAFVFSTMAVAGSYTVSVIPFPSGAPNGDMVGINNSGRVAGTAYYYGPTEQAFIGGPTGSAVIPVPVLSSAINASGQVAGEGTNGAGNGQAFIGTTSGSTAIPYPAGWTSSGAVGVNDSGQVVGFAFNGAIEQAFIGTISGSAVIPMLTGWTFAEGIAINASGQVAGEAFYGFVGGPSQAFIGAASGITLIPLPAGATSATVSGASLNDSGVVVGGSLSGGWIWDASHGTQLLNSMVPSGNISSAISISQNGLILAQGSFNGGTVPYVELVPTGLVPTTPAPGTGFLAVAGLLLVFAWRFRSRLLA